MRGTTGRHLSRQSRKPLALGVWQVALLTTALRDGSHRHILKRDTEWADCPTNQSRPNFPHQPRVWARGVACRWDMRRPDFLPASFKRIKNLNLEAYIRTLLVGGSKFSMGYARRRPKLLPEKLRLIREYLQLDHADMTEQLMSEIKSHSKRRIQIKSHWVRNFELGKHEPDLITLYTYSRLAKVSMNSIVDDDVSSAEFDKRLGKDLKHDKNVSQRTKKTVKP